MLHLDTGLALRGGQRQVLLLMLALRECDWRNVLAAPTGSARAARAHSLARLALSWPLAGEGPSAPAWKARAASWGWASTSGYVEFLFISTTLKAFLNRQSCERR